MNWIAFAQQLQDEIESRNAMRRRADKETTIILTTSIDVLTALQGSILAGIRAANEDN